MGCECESFHWVCSWIAEKKKSILGIGSGCFRMAGTAALAFIHRERLRRKLKISGSDGGKTPRSTAMSICSLKAVELRVES